MPDELASQPATDRAKRRASIYCIVLAVLSAILMFWELGGDALTSDEAQYALVVQDIRNRGEWISPSPYPPTPYFQKPPLYFWLTASTYDLLGREEMAFRAWSAAAGVGAVVLTCMLGSMLFTPEVGALAGLLLMLNRSFLLLHGARSGTFDAVVTFLITAAVLVYVMALRGKRWWLSWILIGVLLGLASMTKPFIGLVPIVLLTPHLLAQRDDRSRRVKVGGLVVALIVIAAIACPWFLAQSSRFGTNELRQNILDRVMQGVDDRHLREWTFYLRQISKSSWPFFFAIPAALYAVFRTFSGKRRSGYGLLAAWGAGWVLLFTLSASKALHYAYPAFPALAIAIACVAMGVADAMGRRCSLDVRPRVLTSLATAVIVAFTFQFVRTIYNAIPDERSPYLPWEMRRALSGTDARPRARTILYGFPEHQADWRNVMGLRARDCYYLEQVRRRDNPIAIQTPEELAAALASREPTLLFLSRRSNLDALAPSLDLAQRTDDRFVYAHQGYLLLGLDTADLLSATLKPGETSAVLSIIENSVQGTVRVSLKPPVRAGARFTARFRLAHPPESIRYTLSLDSGEGEGKRLEDHFVRPSGDGVIEVSAAIEEESLAGRDDHEVVVTLRQVDPSSSVAFDATLERITLSMLPNLPPERHPRR